MLSPSSSTAQPSDRMLSAQPTHAHATTQEATRQQRSEALGGVGEGGNAGGSHARGLRGPQHISQAPTKKPTFTFYEFFAGGGMARAGLGEGWKCLFANDFDHKKSAAYRENWKGKELVTKDVGKVTPDEIPGHAAFVWASFPCQDLSLAGMGAGLRGDRSGTFWPFWRLIEQLIERGRGPKVMVLENVCGTLTSHGGKDFVAIADAVSSAGYRFGAVVIDAAEFVPQSRARLFIIAVSGDAKIPSQLIGEEPQPGRHTRALVTAHARLSGSAQASWIWWNMGEVPARTNGFVDLIEADPDSVKWHTPDETKRLLGMMSAVNRKKVDDAKKDKDLHVGAIYKRTRFDDDGKKVQRAEVRFDNIAGCLRTSTGGSSRQTIIVVKGEAIRSRLISSRETARLMGLPDTYKLPKNYNEAYHLTGDGVVVPVVRHIAASVLEPILIASSAKKKGSQVYNSPTFGAS